MASSTSTPSPPDANPANDDETADLPLTMAASVILEHLPKDAHAALETAGEVLGADGLVKGKGTCFNCRYQTLGPNNHPSSFV